MNPITEKRQEFLAKFLSDLAKAIFAVAFASYFFKEFPMTMRIACGILFIMLSIVSFVIHPDK